MSPFFGLLARYVEYAVRPDYRSRSSLMVPLRSNITSRFSSRQAVALVGQLIWWGTYVGLYYLSLRAYQPFPDLARAKALITGSFGVGVSSVMGWMYNRWEISDQSLPKTAGVILATSVGIGLLWYQGSQWGAEWVNPFIAPVAPYLGVNGSPLLDHVVAFPLVLLLWSGVFLGITIYRKQQRQRQHLLRADAEAQRARLQALRYQLNPHFFFNALNTIEALATERPERVTEVVQQLSGFLRYTLLDEEDLETPLHAEVQAIEHYLAVEKIRFEDDLHVEIDVSPNAGDTLVPSFLVLPLVENAVKHGQRTSPTPLRIRVRGTIENETLKVEVGNTGRWREVNPESVGTDTGLDNVRTRLTTQYPDRHEFNVLEDEGWVRALIEIDIADE